MLGLMFTMSQAPRCEVVGSSLRWILIAGVASGRYMNIQRCAGLSMVLLHPIGTSCEEREISSFYLVPI